MTSPIPPQMASYALAALRIVAALLFIEHGTQKLLAFPIAPPGGAVPAMFTLYWFAGVLEIFVGLMVLVGFFARPAAFVLSGMMAVAYFMAHFPRSFWPVANGGDAAILFCFVFLYIAAAGPGPFSINRR